MKEFAFLHRTEHEQLFPDQQVDQFLHPTGGLLLISDILQIVFKNLISLNTCILRHISESTSDVILF